MKEFKNISLTGRLCYLFMCIETYLVAYYPDKDWTPVAKKCWQWTNEFWEEGCNKYSQVVPEYLFEFDNYEETNRFTFDGELLENDYWELKKLYTGIMESSAGNELNELLELPIDFNNACEGSNFYSADEPTLAIIAKAQSILQKHNIEFPSIDRVSCFTIDQKNGWGDFMDSEYLSIIIKE